MPRKKTVEENPAIEEDEVQEQPQPLRRSKRAVKKPVRYEPVEVVEDDYSDGDETIGSSDDDLSEDIENTDNEEESEDDGSDADENGNLKGFVVYSDEEESDEENS